MGTWLVGWLVNWFNSQLVGVRVTVRVDVPGHRGAADLELAGPQRHEFRNGGSMVHDTCCTYVARKLHVE